MTSPRRVHSASFEGPRLPTRRVVRRWLLAAVLAVCAGCSRGGPGGGAGPTDSAGSEAAVVSPDAAGRATGPDDPLPRNAPGVEIETVADKLDNPCGVAVQPESRHVFVTTRQAVLRVDPADGSTRPQIVGFGTDSYGLGPIYEFGPLGIHFLDAETLVIGGGGQPDGEDLVRLYRVPRDFGGGPLSADQMLASAGPLEAGTQSKRGEGNYFGVAGRGDTLYVTSHGDDTKGWISRIHLTDGRPGAIEPWIKSKRILELDAPGPLLVTERGLLVAQLGELRPKPDSLLVLYDLETGELRRRYATDLLDITGLAEDPESGDLLATDFAWSEPARGGLFRIALGEDGVTTRPLARLDHPTAIARADDGSLYVATMGLEDDEPPRGRLLRVRLP